MSKLSFCFLMMISLSVSAGAYRWVDADGKVHYGDQPPAGAEKLKPPPGPAQAASNDSIPEANNETPEKDEPETPFAAGKADATAAEQCREFQARVKRYEAAGKMFIDNPDGSRYEMQAEERDRLIQRTQAQADAACAKAEAE